MNPDIEQGHRLLREKRFQEAQACFLKAIQQGITNKKAFKGLLTTAQAQKDYPLAIETFEQFLNKYPDDIEASLSLAHLRARQGSLQDYREELASSFMKMENDNFFTIRAGKKFLLAIQYAYSGRERVDNLCKLRERIHKKIKILEKDNNSLAFQILSAEVNLALRDYEQFSKEIDELGEIQDRSSTLTGLQKVLKKYRNPQFPDFQAPKIFGIGLSRTATSSLNSALQILGYHSIHWTNPHTSMLISHQDFFLFDGFTDIPVSYQFEVLYSTFPNSRFIFTTRSMESWVRSVSSHYHNTRSISHPSELNAPSIKQRFDFLAGPIESNLYAKHKTWEEAFQCFEKRVHHFFHDKPSDRFLEFKICDGQGWQELWDFLEVPIPDKEFPNKNKRPTRYEEK